MERLGNHYQKPLTSGKYLVRNRKLKTLIQLSDWLLKCFYFPKKKQLTFSPKRLLMGISGHIGDAILGTAILPVLKKQWPNCKIDVVASSWNAFIFDQHPLLNRTYKIDHWINNQSSIPFLKKICLFLRDRNFALKRIKQEKYCLSIDLSPYFPNYAILFWQANIGIRVGYSSAGFEKLYTHALFWKYENKHMVDYYFDLLRLIGIPKAYKVNLQLSLPKIKTSVRVSLNQKWSSETEAQLEQPYFIFHPGSRSTAKMWPYRHWKQLIQMLKPYPVHIVLTGKGEEERKQSELLCLHSKVINLVNLLNWEEYCLLCSYSIGLIAPDTVAGHVAAVYDKPTITLFSGINNYYHWRPYSKKNYLLFHKMSCMPCHRHQGCHNRECINLLSPIEVFRKLLLVLKSLENKDDIPNQSCTFAVQ